MPKHKETRFLPYTPEQMFDLVADIEQYPVFLPWCKGARIRTREGSIVTADLIIGYKLFHETFTSRVTLNRPKAVMVEYQSGPLSHLSNAWTFKSVKSGTELGFDVEFDFRSSLLSSIMDMFFDKAILKMVAAFEERAKQLYD